jgi:hypothetical protein
VLVLADSVLACVVNRRADTSGPGRAGGVDEAARGVDDATAGVDDAAAGDPGDDAAALRITPRSRSDGTCVATVRVGVALANSAGSLHGGVTAALAAVVHQRCAIDR